MSVLRIDVCLCLLQPLVDKLTTEPDIHVVLKDDGYSRHGGAADAANLADTWQPIHRGLNGIG